MEHSFLMESVLADAKHHRKDVRILWLDLKNAFGSVPHALLWRSIRQLGVPAAFIDIYREIYRGSSQRVRCSEGYTPEIPCRLGIKQGCPLSPLLFNLALEALLPALDGTNHGYIMDNGTTIKQLAFADDLCVIATSNEDVQNALNVIRDFSSWTGLRLNTRKCGCLSAINSSSKGRYVEPISPLYGDEAIPALQWEDKYQYLGIATGRIHSGNRDKLSSSILEIVDKILASKLTEWQKVDALNRFALSKGTSQLHSSGQPDLGSRTRLGSEEKG